METIQSIVTFQLYFKISRKRYSWLEHSKFMLQRSLWNNNKQFSTARLGLGYVLPKVTEVRSTYIWSISLSFRFHFWYRHYYSRWLVPAFLASFRLPLRSSRRTSRIAIDSSRKTRSQLPGYSSTGHSSLRRRSLYNNDWTTKQILSLSAKQESELHEVSNNQSVLLRMEDINERVGEFGGFPSIAG